MQRNKIEKTELMEEIQEKREQVAQICAQRIKTLKEEREKHDFAWSGLNDLELEINAISMSMSLTGSYLHIYLFQKSLQKVLIW